jgi:hypothetical protein
VESITTLVPLAQRKEVEDEIDKMLDNNVIVPSHSPWASPIVVVRKKDNSIRLCMDNHQKASC